MTNYFKPDLLSGICPFESLLDDTLLESVAELPIAQRTRPYSAMCGAAAGCGAAAFWCVVFTVTGGKDYPRPWIHKGLANNRNHPLQPGWP